MNPDEIKKLLEITYADIDGASISREAQSRLNYYFLGLEYGEATFESFYSMLLKSNPQPGDIFYDLGSGIGKKVAIAALGFPFSRSVGIEIIPELQEAARRIFVKAPIHSPLKEKGVVVELKTGDFVHQNISDGDIYYISIVPEILETYLAGELLNKLEYTKKGTRVITSNIVIPSAKFILIDQQISLYSGGTGIMYLHKRI
jgi:hypothetical protein